MTEIKTNTNVFENAFIGVMNILRKKREALFGIIVANYRGDAWYEMKRASYNLNSLTLAWYNHRYCTLDCDDEELNIFINTFLQTSGGNKDFKLDFLDHNEDEESELKRYENAFGDLMMLLKANKYPIFDKINSHASSNNEKNIHNSAHGDDDHEEDIELMKLGHAWKIWCDQNTDKCSVEAFENLHC